MMGKRHEKTETIAVEHSLRDAECAELARRPALDVDDFCRLTEAVITSDHDKGEATYVVSQSGVSFRPVADNLLAMLSSAERSEVVEQTRHRLSFPCSPVELVDFVRAVDHCFALPQEFIDAVTGALARKPDETPEMRRIRFAKMRAAGMSGAEIAKAEGGSVARANELCRDGEALLAGKAAQATTMCGQLALQGVATMKPKTKAT